MKQVKYLGNGTAEILKLSLVVHNGDVVTVPDDFFNALFEDVKPSKTNKKEEIN